MLEGTPSLGAPVTDGERETLLGSGKRAAAAAGEDGRGCDCYRSCSEGDRGKNTPESCER